MDRNPQRKTPNRSLANDHENKTDETFLQWIILRNALQLSVKEGNFIKDFRMVAYLHSLGAKPRTLNENDRIPCNLDVRTFSHVAIHHAASLLNISVEMV